MPDGPETSSPAASAIFAMAQNKQAYGIESEEQLLDICLGFFDCVFTEAGQKFDMDPSRVSKGPESAGKSFLRGEMLALNKSFLFK